MQTLPMLKSTRGYGRWLGAALAVAILAAAPVVSAAPVQFAQFQQTSGTPFVWTNGSPVSTFTLSPPSVQVTFNFLAASGLSTGDRLATMTFSAQTTATGSNFGGFLVQPINGPANIISFTEVGTGKNLLTMIFTGTITGQAGFSNGSLAGATNDGGVTGNKVIYTSDYLAFGGPGGNEASYLIGLPQINPALGLNANGFLNSFTTSAFGGFSTGIAFVPEPASVVMMGTGAALPLWLLISRRRKLAKLARV